MNSVVLIGRLSRDPELSYTANTQTACCKFSIAVDRPRRQGEDQGADFIRIVVWGRQAENCDRYLSKGRQVAVRGRIETGNYKNKDGQTVYTTDVVAESVEFLGSGQGNGNGDQNGGQNYGDQANLPQAMQQAPQGSMPPQANNDPPANNVPPAGAQMGFDMSGDDEPW